MINISVKQDLKGVSDYLRQLPQRQVAFASSLAINKTAQKVKSDLVTEMARTFQQPTRYTLNSLYIKPSNKRILSARIWVKDDTFKGTPAAKYLGPEIFSGARKHKRFERALIAKGLMPGNMYAVPGAVCPRDAYGNVPARFIVQLLAYFQSFGQQGYTANMTGKGKSRFEKKAGAAYFIGRPGNGLPLGIWARYSFSRGSAIKPVLMFVSAPRYSERFKFFEVADHSVVRHFPAAFAEAFKQTMASAR
jgi:hypothetical protein